MLSRLETLRNNLPEQPIKADASIARTNELSIRQVHSTDKITTATTALENTPHEGNLSITSSSADNLAASRIKATLILDYRGNRVDRTVLESRWSKQLTDSLPKKSETFKLLWQHVTEVDRDIAAENREEFKEGNIKEDIQYFMDFIEYTMTPERKDGIEQLFYNRATNELLRRHMTIREDSLFKLRGREDQPEQFYEKERRNSFFNMHGGITQLESTPKDLKNIFSEEFTHSKTTFRGDSHPDSAHGKFLREGIPFIGGMSDTIQFLLEDLETRNYPNKDIEILAVINSALLVLFGHHSLVECIGVAQKMGYFDSLPEATDNYQDFIHSFNEHIKQLGFDQSI